MKGNRCDRCGQEAYSLTMSYFNTEMICFDCEEKEREHPKYSEARKASVKAVQNGNFNFPGIGKPDDL